MLALSKAFGGLNNRIQPHLLGPDAAQDLLNVNLDSQGITPLKALGAIVTSGVGTLRSIYLFNGHWQLSTSAYQYVEYAGSLYRALSGAAPQKTSDGVTWYNLGVPAPAAAATVALNGAAGLLNATYTYYYTYVSVTGAEGAPSPGSTPIVVALGKVDLTNIANSADPQVVKKRLYRSGGATGTLLVVEIGDNTTTTYTDNISDTTLGASLKTNTYAVPANLDGIAVSPSGTFYGWAGNKLYATEEGLPDAWTITIVLNETIKAIVSRTSTTLVITTAMPYVLTGNDASTFRILNTLSQQGCLDRDTAVDMGGRVMWLSPDGVPGFLYNDTEMLSKNGLADAFVAAISATNAKAIRYNEKWLLFHTAGVLEWDPRTPGFWKKSDIVANAVHYNRDLDTLYVADVNNVKVWEGGSAATMLYWTGDWSGETVGILKHLRYVAVEHTGTVTVDTFVDGVAVGAQQTLVRASLGLSIFPVPMGAFGHRVSVRVGGTGTVIEISVGIEMMGQVYD